MERTAGEDTPAAEAAVPPPGIDPPRGIGPPHGIGPKDLPGGPSKGESEALAALRGALAGVLRGQDEVLELALACLLARGHLLLEDAPGTGKTTLARALAQATGLQFSRIQMTADLLPSDVTGARYPMAAPGGAGADGTGDQVAPGGLAHGEFRFIPGPLFTQVLLADELNRTPPRTQSALLESMAEGRVTVEGEEHPLPDPFFVVATQNPAEFAGTFPLPESQLDRFMMRLAPGYPGRDAERAMLRDRRRIDPLAELSPAISEGDLQAALRAVESVEVAPAVEEYLLDLVQATRRDPAFVVGASPRATLDLDRASRALAHLDGRRHVVPEDIHRLTGPVLAHRLILRDESYESGAAEEELARLVAGVDAPQLAPDGSLER